MSIEKLISDTFTAHEHDAPDSDQVLAAARERIDRRRGVRGRPIAVAAGVVVLALAVVGVVALNRPSSDSVGKAPPVDPVIADLEVPFSLGWLPPGEVHYLARRIKIGGTVDAPDTPVYGGEYMLTVRAGDEVLTINVSHSPGPPRKDSFRPMGRPVTINGRPSFEVSHSGRAVYYELEMAHPDGGAIYVGVARQNSSRTDVRPLGEIGRRVARNVSFSGAAVTPDFGLRDLPAGLEVCAFDVSDPAANPMEPTSDSQTSYQVGDCATLPPISVNTAGTRDLPDTRGQAVLGHETRYVVEHGSSKLWVLDAVDGAPVRLSGGVPLADLYAVANSLVLPS